jgi:hypothetical protein
LSALATWHRCVTGVAICATVAGVAYFAWAFVRGSSEARTRSASDRVALRGAADQGRGADPFSAPRLPTVVQSAHYCVSTDVSEQVARSAADLLERAWPIWCERFGVDPDYDPGPGRFSVRIFGAYPAFRRARVEEIEFADYCLGFVDFKGFRLFALHQSDDYEMRRVLLHEGSHQFLYRLAGTSVAQSLPRWYDEGCAHESEKHVLDGERLELFRSTGGGFSSQLEEALGAFRNGRRIEPYLRGRQHALAGEHSYRCCGWAVIHFMRHGGDARQANWFARWEAARLSKTDPSEEIDALVSELGDLRAIDRQLVAYLERLASDQSR